MTVSLNILNVLSDVVGGVRNVGLMDIKVIAEHFKVGMVEFKEMPYLRDP